MNSEFASVATSTSVQVSYVLDMLPVVPKDRWHELSDPQITPSPVFADGTGGHRVLVQFLNYVVRVLTPEAQTKEEIFEALQDLIDDPEYWERRAELDTTPFSPDAVRATVKRIVKRMEGKYATVTPVHRLRSYIEAAEVAIENLNKKLEPRSFDNGPTSFGASFMRNPVRALLHSSFHPRLVESLLHYVIGETALTVFVCVAFRGKELSEDQFVSLFDIAADGYKGLLAFMTSPKDVPKPPRELLDRDERLDLEELEAEMQLAKAGREYERAEQEAGTWTRGKAALLDE